MFVSPGAAPQCWPARAFGAASHGPAPLAVASACLPTALLPCTALWRRSGQPPMCLNAGPGRARPGQAGPGRATCRLPCTCHAANAGLGAPALHRPACSTGPCHVAAARAVLSSATLLSTPASPPREQHSLPRALPDGCTLNPDGCCTLSPDELLYPEPRWLLHPEPRWLLHPEPAVVP